jgi:demethylmenaquinone methyltransferase / 2-methoxy-6-polyprenyl-1,4-benzoquinol methylase
LSSSFAPLTRYNIRSMHPSPADSPVWDDGRLADPHGQPDKATRVRAMFDEIAPTYERVNRVLSAGRDASWRRRAVKMAAITPHDRVLDLACGTGDFARAFAAVSPKLVVGCDFAEQMLRHAANRRNEAIGWCLGDALTLPFAARSFSVASCAFGVRNWQAIRHPRILDAAGADGGLGLSVLFPARPANSRDLDQR